jgi:hypothetical protein
VWRWSDGESSPLTFIHTAPPPLTPHNPQGYFDKNPTQGYCRAVVRPKVEKLAAAYGELLK